MNSPMNSPPCRQTTPNSRPRGIRPGFFIGVTSLVAILAFSLWLYQRPKPQPAAPVEAPEVAATSPPTVHPVPAPQTHVVKHPGGRGRRFRAPVAPPGPPPSTLENQWGIQVCSMRLSMGNSVVDLRYKILNPEKVAALANGKTRAYILEPVTGTKLVMPTPPKEGAFPPTANKLTVGKTYFAMVSNQKGLLHSGDRVSVMIGDALATNLTIE